MKKLIIFIFLCITAIGCNKKTKQLPTVAVRDTTITVENSFTELFIDSAALDRFILAHPMEDSLSNKMHSFYNHRNYQFAWFFPEGTADFISSFLSLQNDYIHYSGDSSLYNPALQTRIDSLAQLKKINPKDTLVVSTELMLTQQFFKYTSLAYSGDHKINVQELNWYIPRKKSTLKFSLILYLKIRGKICRLMSR
ncbi:hypothetical protein [Dyadobacter sp. NIV53]|uniref:hypothetical protein n=1 Tax=Dyadobacter sp. NIV53 TaxID=2861765 RepID=UPI001E56290B|nr:hypothetical protein [Dyadobacter sp. NIV53]